jgi:hypothetical protein
MDDATGYIWTRINEICLRRYFADNPEALATLDRAINVEITEEAADEIISRLVARYFMYNQFCVRVGSIISTYRQAVRNSNEMREHQIVINAVFEISPISAEPDPVARPRSLMANIARLMRL